MKNALCALLLLIGHVATGTAQPATFGGETRFRIINLLPIGKGKVDLYQGGSPLLIGMKSGFSRNYSGGNETGSKSFDLRQGGNVIAQARMDATSSPEFASLIIFQDASGSVGLRVWDDTLKTGVDENGKPLPQNRLRVFSGSYGFPITVSAEKLGNWVVGGEPLFTEVAFDAGAPESVAVSFRDTYDQPVNLHFPTDFKTHKAYSVFVTHRGEKRPRVAAFPDAIAPMEDPLLASERASAGPAPTPPAAVVP